MPSSRDVGVAVPSDEPKTGLGSLFEKYDRYRATPNQPAGRSRQDQERAGNRPLARDPKQRAVELERLGRHMEAAAAFEDAGMPERALHNWREAGQYEKALPLATGKTEADLKWMIRAEKLMARRPQGIQDRLEDAERKRLGKAMRLPRPKR